MSKTPEDIIKRANKKAKPFLGLFANKFDQEDAVELYEQAAHLYKVQGEPLKAAHTFLKGAELARSINNYDAAKLYSLAGDFFNHSNEPILSSDAMNKAIQIYLDEGNGRNASKLYVKLAESEDDLDQRLELYQNAVEQIKYEEHSNIYTLKLKIVDILITIEQYQEAIKVYQELIDSKIVTGTIWMLSDLCAKQCLCYLTNDDIVGCERQMRAHEDQLPALDQHREYKFLSDIVASLKDCDKEYFNRILYEEDRVKTFSPLMVKMLLKIKDHFMESEDDFTASEDELC